jgi:hypothetical protein
MIDIMGRSANGQQGTRVDALDTVNKKKFSKGLKVIFYQEKDSLPYELMCHLPMLQ